MTDYTILALLILFCAGVPNALSLSSKKVGFWFCIFVLIILSSLRGANIGNDTHSYIYLFKNLSAENHSRYEIGYVFLNDIIKKITDNYQYLFTIISIFVYFSIGRFIIKYSKIPWLSLFLFLTYGFFTFTFSALRQAIAITICLYAFESMMNSKNIKAFLLIFLASLFHNTAIVFLFAFICKFIKPSGKVFIVGYISSFIILVAFTTVLYYVFQMLPMYKHYSQGTYIGEIGIASFLYAILSSIILLFSYKQLTSGIKKSGFISKVDSYGLIMVLLAVVFYIISIKANIFDRMAIYFNILSIIILPNAINKLSGVNRQFITVIVVVVFYIYSAMIIYYRPEWNSVFPYSFYWQ